MKSKFSADVITRQRNVVHELMQAQNKSFVSKIDIVLEESSKIVYDPDCAMYRSELEPVEERIYSEDLKDLPPYTALHVRFADHVSYDTINKIADYVKCKYKCKFTSYIVKKQLDFYSFE